MYIAIGRHYKDILKIIISILRRVVFFTPAPGPLAQAVQTFSLVLTSCPLCCEPWRSGKVSGCRGVLLLLLPGERVERHGLGRRGWVTRELHRSVRARGRSMFPLMSLLSGMRSSSSCKTCHAQSPLYPRSFRAAVDQSASTPACRCHRAASSLATPQRVVVQMATRACWALEETWRLAPGQ